MDREEIERKKIRIFKQLHPENYNSVDNLTAISNLNEILTAFDELEAENERLRGDIKGLFESIKLVWLAWGQSNDSEGAKWIKLLADALKRAEQAEAALEKLNCPHFNKCMEEGYKQEEPEEDPDIVSDGFGTSCSAWCPECGQKTMYVCRPGDIRCCNCYDHSPDMLKDDDPEEELREILDDYAYCFDATGCAGWDISRFSQNRFIADIMKWAGKSG